MIERKSMFFGKYSSFWSKIVLLALFLHLAYLYFMVKFPVKINETEQFTIHTPDSKRRRLVNEVITEYDDKIGSRLQALVEEKVSADDTRLVALIKELMDPPSNHIVKTVRTIYHTPQSTEVIKVLEEKHKGFFVECGALDGERSSNTLYLEQRMGWKGLLVEMDPYFYTQLRGKSRQAWSINACLSPYNYPTVMAFKESTGGGGQLVDNRNISDQDIIRKVPCFPFHSLMLALNQTTVDFFSLDVEGFELEILRTVPFDKVDIGVLTVEYLHGRSGKDAYKAFMEGKGYSVYKDIHFKDLKLAMFVDDFIFIKNKWKLDTKS